MATLHGSGFSIQPKFSQSAYFRFHNQSEVFKNLYFVGAGTHPGAGMPGVLSSAKVLDNFFNEREFIRKTRKIFLLGKFFLSKEIFYKCVSLYNFCRTLDDIVDDASDLKIKKEKFSFLRKIL